MDVAGGSNCKVEGNHVGINPAATQAFESYFGIKVGGPRNIIGGRIKAKRNIISGDLNYGIYVNDDLWSWISYSPQV